MGLQMFLHETNYSSGRVLGLLEELTANGANVLISGSDDKAGILLVAELCAFIGLRRNTRILLDKSVRIQDSTNDGISTKVSCNDSKSEYTIETNSKALQNLLLMEETSYYDLAFGISKEATYLKRKERKKYHVCLFKTNEDGGSNSNQPNDCLYKQ